MPVYIITAALNKHTEMRGKWRVDKEEGKSSSGGEKTKRKGLTERQ
jgi:hypothetical protein